MDEVHTVSDHDPLVLTAYTESPPGMVLDVCIAYCPAEFNTSMIRPAGIPGMTEAFNALIPLPLS